jgi:peptidoglycan/xylan/chitin deacetylase (PgdA/CDA1 family)
MTRTGPNQIILSYHGVSSNWDSPLAVPEEVLAEQLSLLRNRGYEGYTFSQWERLRAANKLPPRSVVVTFDDGYASTLKAVPILQELDFPGTVFPVVSFVESGEPLSWPGISHWLGTEWEGELQPLAWDQLAELSSRGWEVGSHTLTHPDLPKTGDEALRVELEESRAVIARRLGHCEAIAYPYGNANDRVANAARRAGYTAGCTLSRFHLVDEPLQRPRTALFLNDSGARLRLKLSRLATAVRDSRLLSRLIRYT